MALGWASGPCLPLFLGVLVATGWSRQPQSFPAASEVAMLGSKRWRSYVLLCPSGLHPWLALELTFPSGPDSAVISRAESSAAWRSFRPRVSPRGEGGESVPPGHAFFSTEWGVLPRSLASRCAQGSASSVWLVGPHSAHPSFLAPRCILSAGVPAAAALSPVKIL